jgi:hypothetical protein
MSAAANTPAITTRVREDDNVPDHLQCYVCLDAPPNNAQQCRFGHLLCGEEGSCLSKLRSSAIKEGKEPQCPACRTPLPEELSKCLSAEHSIALLPATCRHCTEKTTRGALVAHERSCPSAPDVTCAAQADGCAWKGCELDRAAHELECAIVRLRARFDVEREATSRATTIVMDALLDSHPQFGVRWGKALFLAAEHDNLTLVEHLCAIAGARPGLVAFGSIVNAARRGDGFTPLYLACKNGNVAMVERLIAAGSQVDKVSKRGTPLFMAAHDNRLDVVTLLIAAGADVNKAGFHNATPLHGAAQNGHAGIVSVLLETPGVDLNPALFMPDSSLHITDLSTTSSAYAFHVSAQLRVSVHRVCHVWRLHLRRHPQAAASIAVHVSSVKLKGGMVHRAKFVCGRKGIY